MHLLLHASLAAFVRPCARARMHATRAKVRASEGPVTVYSQALDEVLERLQQKPYRRKQIRKWVYECGVTDFQAMTNLPKPLQAQLRHEVASGSMEVATEQESRDGTRKRLLRLHDGKLIESVLMPYSDNRRTACISSQAGCAMGCTFCATGTMGFQGDLSAGEILEQVRSTLGPQPWHPP